MQGLLCYGIHMSWHSYDLCLTHCNIIYNPYNQTYIIYILYIMYLNLNILDLAFFVAKILVSLGQFIHSLSLTLDEGI